VKLILLNFHLKSISSRTGMPGNVFEEGSIERGGFASPTAEQPERMGVAVESVRIRLRTTSVFK
jgi:hypothetical protein